MKIGTIVVLVVCALRLIQPAPGLAQQLQPVDWPAIREQIRSADNQFRASRNNLQAISDPVTKQSLYPRPRVEGFIRGNQERVNGALSAPPLRGMRDHVSGYSNQAVGMLKKTSSPFCPDCVTVESTNQAYEFLSLRNAGLFELPSVEMDLDGSSKPDAARLQLFYVDGPPYQETSTINQLHIYRGKYDTRMTKAGFKVGKLQIDLVENRGTVLHCNLAPESASTDSDCALRNK
jgi:hypothetical protein